jgi:GNAT superfamily N-acetyltransferase
MPDEITLRTEAADSLIAVRLVEAMVAEMEQLYSLPPGTGLGTGAPPADFAPPGGTFLVIYADGKPVAGGGVKRDEDGVAEIKRMYVVPEARGQGLGRRLLEELEAAARELGYARIRLDTGDRQPHAQAMYERAGYHRIDNYNGNPQASFWGEKILR